MLRTSIGIFRNVFRKNVQLPRLSVSRPVAAKSQIFYQRSYASSSKLDGELVEEERVKKIISVFRENPEIKTVLDEFQKLLAEKGLQPDGNQPTMVQMMKILADKEVKTALMKLKGALDSANVQLTQEDLNAFMNLYGLKK